VHDERREHTVRYARVGQPLEADDASCVGAARS
jgi:hypothetical protein